MSDYRGIETLNLIKILKCIGGSFLIGLMQLRSKISMNRSVTNIVS